MQKRAYYYDNIVKFGSVNEMKEGYQALLTSIWEMNDESLETLALYIGSAYKRYKTECLEATVANENSERAKAQLFGFLEVTQEFNV